MNSVQILGNLARDPEVRYTKTGRAVATFTVAATNTYIDSTTNETKEQTAFINCVAWGKLGEAAGNLRKGSRCFVEGRLQLVPTRLRMVKNGTLLKWWRTLWANPLI